LRNIYIYSSRLNTVWLRERWRDESLRDRERLRNRDEREENESETERERDRDWGRWEFARERERHPGENRRRPHPPSSVTGTEIQWGRERNQEPILHRSSGSTPTSSRDPIFWWVARGANFGGLVAYFPAIQSVAVFTLCQ
jgi:hypothetical protein